MNQDQYQANFKFRACPTHTASVRFFANKHENLAAKARLALQDKGGNLLLWEIEDIFRIGTPKEAVMAGYVGDIHPCCTESLQVIEDTPAAINAIVNALKQNTLIGPDKSKAVGKIMELINRL